MNLLFSRIENLDGELNNFELTGKNQLSRDQFDLIHKSYLYTVYYYPIATGEISEEDLTYFGLLDPPFSKAVFILQREDQFFKLNYSISPMEYYISEYNPDTNDSNLITDQSRDLYGILRSMLKILPWEEYSKLYHLGTFSAKKSEEESLLIDHAGLMLQGEGSDQFGSSEGGLIFSGGDDAELELAPTGIAPIGEASYEIDQSESTEGLAFAESSAPSQGQFDKLSIKQRQIKLEQFQEDLKHAERIAEIRKELKGIQSEIKAFEGVKKEITQQSVAISKKEGLLDRFSGIKWISEEIYKSLLGYEEATIKYNETQNMINTRLEKIERDIKNIQHDDIFSNKMFLASFSIGTISYLVSWMVRDPLRWLAILSIIAFTLSVYYLWGYFDYLDFFRKLRRQRSFFKKKRIEETSQFQQEYSQVERLIRQHSIKELPPVLEEATQYFALLSEIEKSKDKLDDYCMKHFNEKLQNQFKKLLVEYDIKDKEQKRLTKKELNVEEVKYLINTLKESIKKYEKKELEEFSLDDPIEEVPEIPEVEEEVVPEPEPQREVLFNAGYNYLNQFQTFFMVSPEELFKKVESVLISLIQHYSSNQILLKNIDDTFHVLYSETFTLQDQWENDFLYLIQFALIITSLEKKPTPFFIDPARLPESTKITSEFLDQYIDGIQTFTIAS